MTRRELIEAFERLAEAADAAQQVMARCEDVPTKDWAALDHAVTVAFEQIGDARIGNRRALERAAVEIDRDMSMGGAW